MTGFAWRYRQAARQGPRQRTGERWTAVENDRLRLERERGCSWEQIADAHARSVFAVQRQAMKVGLLRQDVAQLGVDATQA
jgi:hypothetical protein